MVVLPELWSSGYDLERCQMHARVSQEKGASGISIIGTPPSTCILLVLCLKPNSRREVFNSAVLLDPGAGPIRVYRKIHLFGPMLENRFLTRAHDAVFHLPFGAVALAICYDLRFPELFRKYALKARATGNSLCAVACGQIGTLAHFGACAGHRESILYRRL